MSLQPGFVGSEAEAYGRSAERRHAIPAYAKSVWLLRKIIDSVPCIG